jgi:hypothetical protein
MRSKLLWLMLILLVLTACTTVSTPAAPPNSAQAAPIATSPTGTDQTVPTLPAATEQAIPTLTTEPTAPPQSDLLVYQAWDDGPLPELIVLQPDGTEVHRIALPKTVEYIESTFAMRGNHTALAVTSDGRWFVIRAAQGEVQELEFPGDLRSEMSLGWDLDTVGHRWAIMEDKDREHFYLVDLQTGQLTDLATINNEFRFIDQIQLSQRDDFLAILTKNGGLWLVPTAEPSKARHIKTTLRPSTGYLSDDGQFVVFKDKRSSTKPVLVSENVDSGERQEIAFRDDLFGVRSIANSSQAVLMQPDGRVWFDLATKKAIAQIPIAKQEQVGESFVSPDHEKYFYNWYGTTAPQGEWIVIESSTGVTRTIPDLAGYFPKKKTRQILDDPWVLMLKVISESKPEKFQMAAFDARSEKVSPLMTFESSNPLGQLQVTPNSQFGLFMQDVPNGKQQLWLLNAATGKASLIAEADMIGGAVSLSDDWAVTNTIDLEAKKLKVNIINLETGQALSVDAGTNPEWVVP